MNFECLSSWLRGSRHWCAVVAALFYVSGACAASGQSGEADARIPDVMKLKSRVTDPDGILEREELRVLSRELESRARNRALEFYLVIYAKPLGRDLAALAEEFQKNTVPRGPGGVILVSFADQRVSVFLTEEMLEYIAKDELQKILDRAVAVFDPTRTISDNLRGMFSQLLNDLDELRERDRKRRQRVPWIVSLAVSAAFLFVGLSVAGFILLRKHNLFDRAYYFRETAVVERYGGRMSGGHSAEVTFPPRPQRMRR